MGSKSSKHRSSDFSLENFSKNYNFEKNIAAHFGVAGGVYFLKNNENEKVLKLIKTAEPNETPKIFSKTLEKRIKLKHSNLLEYFALKYEDSGSKKDIGGICSLPDINTTAYLFVEWHEHNLQREIEMRLYEKDFFSESELWYLLTCLISVCDYLQQHEIFHGDIRPVNILLTEEGEVKITDNSFVSRFPTAYRRMLETDDRLSFLSPEELYFWVSQELPPLDFNQCKSDVFSLGMTMCYDLDEKVVVNGDIREVLNEIRQRYSQTFIAYEATERSTFLNVRTSIEDLKLKQENYFSSKDKHETYDDENFYSENYLNQPLEVNYKKNEIPNTKESKELSKKEYYNRYFQENSESTQRLSPGYNERSGYYQSGFYPNVNVFQNPNPSFSVFQANNSREFVQEPSPNKEIRYKQNPSPNRSLQKVSMSPNRNVQYYQNTMERSNFTQQMAVSNENFPNANINYNTNINPNPNYNTNINTNSTANFNTNINTNFNTNTNNPNTNISFNQNPNYNYQNTTSNSNLSVNPKEVPQLLVPNINSNIEPVPMNLNQPSNFYYNRTEPPSNIENFNFSQTTNNYVQPQPQPQKLPQPKPQPQPQPQKLNLEYSTKEKDSSSIKFLDPNTNILPDNNMNFQQNFNSFNLSPGTGGAYVHKEKIVSHEKPQQKYVQNPAIVQKEQHIKPMYTTNQRIIQSPNSKTNKIPNDVITSPVQTIYPQAFESQRNLNPQFASPPQKYVQSNVQPPQKYVQSNVQPPQKYVQSNVQQYVQKAGSPQKIIYVQSGQKIENEEDVNFVDLNSRIEQALAVSKTNLNKAYKQKAD